MPSVRPPRRDDRERTAYRGESSSAGVVTKRIDRGDGASELSFYAIGPKRSTYGEALADLHLLSGALHDFVFACPACGHPGAQTVEPDVDIHAGASYTCDQCGADVHFEALTRAEYLALANEAAAAVRLAARAWTYCCDALPETAGRYEVACWTTNGVLVGQPLRLFRFFSTFSEEGRWRLSNWSPPEGGHETVYAWRPIVEDPPPLRPADRDFLLAAGVPAEWLTEPKGD
jgi:hypothetical protein